MTVVVKGNQITVIRINAGSSDNRSAKVTTDVIKNGFGIATVGLGINIETIGMIFIFLNEFPSLCCISLSRAERKEFRRKEDNEARNDRLRRKGEDFHQW